MDSHRKNPPLPPLEKGGLARAPVIEGHAPATLAEGGKSLVPLFRGGRGDSMQGICVLHHFMIGIILNLLSEGKGLTNV